MDYSRERYTKGTNEKPILGIYLVGIGLRLLRKVCQGDPEKILH